MLVRTKPLAPGSVIPAADKRGAGLQVLRELNQALPAGLGSNAPNGRAWRE